MKSVKLFPTRLFGYKKKAVNAYLLENGERNQTKLNEQYDKVDELVQENYALKAQLEALTEENRALKAEHAEFLKSKEVIGNAILDAEKQAAEIIKKAEEEKERLDTEIKEAQETLKKLHTDKTKIKGSRPVVRLKRQKQ